MRFFLFILWAIHWLPLPILGRMGKLLGTCAYHFWARRRRITLTNLRLCFPDMPEPLPSAGPRCPSVPSVPPMRPAQWSVYW